MVTTYQLHTDHTRSRLALTVGDTIEVDGRTVHANELERVEVGDALRALGQW